MTIYNLQTIEHDECSECCANLENGVFYCSIYDIFVANVWEFPIIFGNLGICNIRPINCNNISQLYTIGDTSCGTLFPPPCSNCFRCSTIYTTPTGFCGGGGIPYRWWLCLTNSDSDALSILGSGPWAIIGTTPSSFWKYGIKLSSFNPLGINTLQLIKDSTILSPYCSAPSTIIIEPV